MRIIAPPAHFSRWMEMLTCGCGAKLEVMSSDVEVRHLTVDEGRTEEFYVKCPFCRVLISVHPDEKAKAQVRR